MKKLGVIVVLMAFAALANAQVQHDVNSFFDELGTAKIQTVEFSPAGDTIIKVFHRMDDVVWARYVYRVIDLRYKQNFQLYFPAKFDDPDYRNLFKLILDAICQGLPVYRKNDNGSLKPEFIEPMGKAEIASMTLPVIEPDNADETYADPTKSDYMLLHYDSITDAMTFHFYQFNDYVRNQYKFLIQEVVFFDKHTSRLHSKIMAIAPLQADRIQTGLKPWLDGGMAADEEVDSTEVAATEEVADENIEDEYGEEEDEFTEEEEGGEEVAAVSDEKDVVIRALWESMLFWIPFDNLRPYMAMQYVIPSQNEVKRVTYDEFFQKRLYSSYIVGEGDMYNRLIPNYAEEEKDIKAEQERIATELLNFELDLWEY